MAIANALVSPLHETEGFQGILDCINAKSSPVLATGVIDAQKTHLMYGLTNEAEKSAVILTQSELRANEIYEDLQFFMRDNVMQYPSKDVIFYSADVHSMDIVKQRFAVIDSLIQGRTPTIVLSVEALLDRLIPMDTFKEFILEYEVGDFVGMDELSASLVQIGYERTDVVVGTGQFSVRGGIIDIYPMTMKNAVRIELWDDEIDSIRYIDTYTQRSVDKTNSVRIFPMRELVYDDEMLKSALKKITADYQETCARFTNNGFLEELETLKSSVGADIEKLTETRSTSGVLKYIQYFCDNTVTLLDYISKDALLFFDDPLKTAAHVENVFFEFQESVKNHISKGHMLPLCSTMIFDYSQIVHDLHSFMQVLMMTFPQRISGFNPIKIFSFSVKSTTPYKGRLELLENELKSLKEQSYRIVILSGSRSRAERLSREFEERGISTVYCDDYNSLSLEESQIAITRGSLLRGFMYTDIRFAIISEREIFGEEKRKKSKKKKSKSSKIDSFMDLKIGDYVVHDSHGIGIYRGIEKVSMVNVIRDYLKIEYADGGCIYASVDQMNLIQKFIGSDAKSPKISKLGTSEWSKAKSRARKAVAILAEDLVQLYAKRQESKGFAYSSDSVWQTEFEEMFPYEETDDQLVAIEDVKKDMESPRVMDRLICGDVGYGKTEVAIRAAFKAVQDNKQVAYLVPTTILAQQHYNTFVQRMSNFPISIEMLSRFRTPHQQKKIIEDLSNGRIDIVIGTHRIISKDMKFRDLGLVIIDEEQRFGVAHKEKLKLLKENVDVLTLTATPIPRTLHMSLTGLRDMSILEDPPQERQPIQTYVMEHNTEFIRDAVHRELSRNGQIYYLHNRVRNIAETAYRLQNLIPEATITYAHGQMSERELESIMTNFINGEIDMLVCTTIIETGLDIPNVNTIIIHDADHMGLSQLYQLRGRVGRSNRIAYAYLMYKKDKILQEVAEKRLQTIREFTEFGSGFKIAMRDLEIRGAGNLLGAEQHGHMESVGYDMYCKLLEEAVCKLQGKEVATELDTTIDVSINAFIPAYYITDEETKLEIYKKISLIKTPANYMDVEEEIEDRFGDLPQNVKNLLDVALLRAEANDIGVTEIKQKQQATTQNIIITFKPDADIDPLKIAEVVKQSRGGFMFTSTASSPYITYKIGKPDIPMPEVLSNIKNMLQSLKY